MSSRKQDVAPGRLDHVGVAVRSLEDALAPYKDGLGLIVSEIEELPTEKVRVAFLPMGESRLELLEPTADDSPIARFLQRRGEGIHHLCFQVDDIEAVLKRLKKAGVELVDEKARAAAASEVSGLEIFSREGVRLEHLPGEPRDISGQPGAEYYKVEPHGDYWSRVREEYNLALSLGTLVDADVRLYIVSHQPAVGMRGSEFMTPPKLPRRRG